MTKEQKDQRPRSRKKKASTAASVASREPRAKGAEASDGIDVEKSSVEHGPDSELTDEEIESLALEEPDERDEPEETTADGPTGGFKGGRRTRTEESQTQAQMRTPMSTQDTLGASEHEFHDSTQSEPPYPNQRQAVSIPSTALVKAERGLATRDALQQYMLEVERHPLLTREQEHELAIKFKKKGDLDAAYKLVTANLRLVVKIAHEYHRHAFSLLDLIQEGNVGLMHAVKKYDPDRGVKLSSYAAWWIRAYILRYVMENARMVKLGTTQAQRKLFFNLRKEQARLAAEGFDPTPKLLAERLNVSEQDVADMDQRLSQDEFSIDAPIASDESAKTARSERFASSATPVDDSIADEQLKEIMREKLAEFGKKLKEKELYIFQKRLVAEEPITLQEIGDKYGITRERARQIEAKLIRDLRTWIQDIVPDFKYLEINQREN